MPEILVQRTIKKKAASKKFSFFFVMALVALFASVVGFATTFIIPVSKGSFKAPTVIYVHGALAFAWVLLFLIQTIFISTREHKKHMALGSLGLFLAIAITITMLPLSKFVVEKELGPGFGDTAYSNIVGLFSSGIIFLVLVITGINKRKKPQTHKRLLLLATIVLIWPAWFRFRHYFPSVPRPDIWFAVVLADSLIIIAWIRDKIALGRIHPTLLYIGTLIILEHIFEVVFFDSGPWRALGKMIYSFY